MIINKKTNNMKSENIEKAYALAKERYAALGVNTDKAIEIGRASCRERV